jgi:hypothetical protein
VRVTLSPELGSALDAPVVEFVAVVRGTGEVEEVARAPLAGAFGKSLSFREHGLVLVSSRREKGREKPGEP